MSQNLFVGSLSYNTTNEGLKAFFETIGEVKSAQVISDKFSGRSKGFGFVEFADETNNQKAISELHDKELDGRAIIVKLSEPRERQPRREGGRNFGGDRRERRDFSNDRRSNTGNSFRNRY